MSHHYPRKRKSPIRHHVKSHTRLGHRVQEYMRGHGTRPLPYAKIRRISREEGSARKSMEDYTITFYYSNKQTKRSCFCCRERC